MQRKVRTIAITVPFILFMAGEQQAHPLSEILRGVDEPRAVAQETAAPDAVENLAQPQTAARAEATVTKKKPRATRRRPRRMATRRRQRKSREDSTAALAARRLHILKEKYNRRTRRHLVITSSGRGPAAQARAIRQNIRAYGVSYVNRLYGGSPAIREILRAYKANRMSPRRAQRQMARVIHNQMARNVYVSDHLRGRAIDVRSHGRGAARLSVLRDVAHEVGAEVSVERNHYHIRLA